MSGPSQNQAPRFPGNRGRARGWSRSPPRISRRDSSARRGRREEYPPGSNPARSRGDRTRGCHPDQVEGHRQQEHGCGVRPAGPSDQAVCPAGLAIRQQPRLGHQAHDQFLQVGSRYGFCAGARRRAFDWGHGSSPGEEGGLARSRRVAPGLSRATRRPRFDKSGQGGNHLTLVGGGRGRPSSACHGSIRARRRGPSSIEAIAGQGTGAVDLCSTPGGVIVSFTARSQVLVN